jgi:hypothetical protein
LTETDLNAAWAYYVSHAKEIEAAIKANEIGQEDNATAQTVNSFQLPDEQLADLAKTRMPPQSWYDKDESFF